MPRTPFVASFVLLAGCLLKATPIPYTPQPEAVKDPIAELRAALSASTTCQASVEVLPATDEIVVHKICPTGFRDAPKDDPQRVAVRKITKIFPARGDWAFVDVLIGEREVFHWSFGDQLAANQDAIRVADAFAALRERGVGKP